MKVNNFVFAAQSFEDLRFVDRGTLYRHMQAVTTYRNGYGASVISGNLVNAGSQHLYEIAVIQVKGDNWELFEPHEVVGYLTQEEVTEMLNKIENMEVGNVVLR